MGLGHRIDNVNIYQITFGTGLWDLGVNDVVDQVSLTSVGFQTGIALFVYGIHVHSCPAGHQQPEVWIVRDGSVVTTWQWSVLDRLVVSVSHEPLVDNFYIPRHCSSAFREWSLSQFGSFCWTGYTISGLNKKNISVSILRMKLSVVCQ